MMSLPGSNFFVLIQKLPPVERMDVLGIPVRTLSLSLYCQNVPAFGVVKSSDFSSVPPFRVYLNLKDAPLGRSV